MGVTASVVGSYQLIIWDADGTVALDPTLIKVQGNDSLTGISSAGLLGIWELTSVL